MTQDTPGLEVRERRLGAGGSYRWLSSGLVPLLCVLASPAVGAPPQHRVLYNAATVLRYNPLGLQVQGKLAYQYKLYDSDSLLFRTGYVGAFFEPIISPALARVGVGVEAEPIAVLQLGAKAEWLQFYGTFNHLQSFPGADVDWSDSAVERAADASRDYAPGGWQANIFAVLRARVGPLVLRSRLTAMTADMDLRSGDTTWYDPYFDVLQPDGGWTLVNDADLLLMLKDERLIVGLRHNTTHALHDEGGFDATQRLGPLVAYRFYDEPDSTLNRPTIFLLLNWYLSHPFRTGEDTSQAIPYVALGFAVSGEIL